MANTSSTSASNNSRVWFITGCSSGFGRALVEATLARGYKVVATARKLDKIKDFEQQYPDTALAIAFHLTTAFEGAAVGWLHGGREAESEDDKNRVYRLL